MCPVARIWRPHAGCLPSGLRPRPLPQSSAWSQATPQVTGMRSPQPPHSGPDCRDAATCSGSDREPTGSHPGSDSGTGDRWGDPSLPGPADDPHLFATLTQLTVSMKALSSEHVCKEVWYVCVLTGSTQTKHVLRPGSVQMAHMPMVGSKAKAVPKVASGTEAWQADPTVPRWAPASPGTPHWSPQSPDPEGQCSSGSPRPSQNI